MVKGYVPDFEIISEKMKTRMIGAMQYDDNIYHVLNFKDDFKEKVIDRFIAAYECGDTPNPCIYCNRYIR